jgi:hypothetical protein
MSHTFHTSELRAAGSVINVRTATRVTDAYQIYKYEFSIIMNINLKNVKPCSLFIV